MLNFFDEEYLDVQFKVNDPTSPELPKEAFPLDSRTSDFINLFNQITDAEQIIDALRKMKIDREGKQIIAKPHFQNVLREKILACTNIKDFLILALGISRLDDNLRSLFQNQAEASGRLELLILSFMMQGASIDDKLSIYDSLAASLIALGVRRENISAMHNILYDIKFFQPQVKRLLAKLTALVQNYQVVTQDVPLAAFSDTKQALNIVRLGLKEYRKITAKIAALKSSTFQKAAQTLFADLQILWETRIPKDIISRVP